MMATSTTVLVADDSPGIRRVVRAALERLGHTVLEASSANEVLEELDRHPPDVMLLDIHLGSDDGLALGVGLREDEQYRNVRVVFMTGTMGETELIRLSRLWNVQILSKPFEINALRDAIG
jgi:two-component system, chemotaxis family, chemotaxis protein CheY